MSNITIESNFNAQVQLYLTDHYLLMSNIKIESNFIAYYVGHHGVLFASDDFYPLSTLDMKFKKVGSMNLVMKKNLL